MANLTRLFISIVLRDYDSIFIFADKEVTIEVTLPHKVQTVQECDARDDAIKNFSRAQKKFFFIFPIGH